MRDTVPRMCPFARFLLSIGLFLVSFIYPYPVVVAKGPIAVLPQSEYDFGTALEGNTVVHDFVIQNKGDEPLIIHRVRTG